MTRVIASRLLCLAVLLGATPAFAMMEEIQLEPSDAPAFFERMILDRQRTLRYQATQKRRLEEAKRKVVADRIDGKAFARDLKARETIAVDEAGMPVELATVANVSWSEADSYGVTLLIVFIAGVGLLICAAVRMRERYIRHRNSKRKAATSEQGLQGILAELETRVKR
jgi:hypothetical protein